MRMWSAPKNELADGIAVVATVEEQAVKGALPRTFHREHLPRDIPYSHALSSLMAEFTGQ